MASSNPRQQQQLWPTVHAQFPKPWGLPLMMSGMGTIPWLQLVDKHNRLFKNHNMEASLEMPIPVPSWILDNFHGMLQDPTDRYMQLTLYRYRGELFVS